MAKGKVLEMIANVLTQIHQLFMLPDPFQWHF